VPRELTISHATAPFYLATQAGTLTRMLEHRERGRADRVPKFAAQMRQLRSELRGEIKFLGTQLAPIVELVPPADAMRLRLYMYGTALEMSARRRGTFPTGGQCLRIPDVSEILSYRGRVPAWRPSRGGTPSYF
jgi:hypothetical protein